PKNDEAIDVNGKVERRSGAAVRECRGQHLETGVEQRRMDDVTGDVRGDRLRGADEAERLGFAAPKLLDAPKRRPELEARAPKAAIAVVRRDSLGASRSYGVEATFACEGVPSCVLVARLAKRGRAVERPLRTSLAGRARDLDPRGGSLERDLDARRLVRF